MKLAADGTDDRGTKGAAPKIQGAAPFVPRSSVPSAAISLCEACRDLRFLAPLS